MSAILDDGSRIGILGGGPAGSLCAYFLLRLAQQMDMELQVDIYEPRDFFRPGPGSCNMCGGIVSESLIQAWALEGINLPSAVVQRGIDSYVLHTDDTGIRIDTPLREKRIAAVHRGGGPRDVKEVKWGGFDGYLLNLARDAGARIVAARVNDVAWDGGRPQVHLKEGTQTYDLLVGAVGVNSAGWQLFENLGFRGNRPETTRAYITELNLGADTIAKHFGSSMHMFLLDIPRLDFGAIIPKGDFVTVCLLGKDIDDELTDAFFKSPAVRSCLPESWSLGEGACHCSPRISIKEAATAFIDRVVLIGDCGVTRLYKDGIGAAYRTAKAAALTAVFSGVSAADFQKDFWPTYRSIAYDNRCGVFIFSVVHMMKRLKPVLRGVLKMTAREQSHPGVAKRMSMVLWDMFTGSAPYRDVFFRTLDPRFMGRLAWETTLAPGSRLLGKGG